MTVGTIYFIQAGGITGPIKIGYTKNQANVRKKCAQTYNHLALELLADTAGTQPEEKALHGRFRRYRIRGEWFNPAPPIMELIAAIMDDGLRISNWLEGYTSPDDDDDRI